MPPAWNTQLWAGFYTFQTISLQLHRHVHVPPMETLHSLTLCSLFCHITHDRLTHASLAAGKCIRRLISVIQSSEWHTLLCDGSNGLRLGNNDSLKTAQAHISSRAHNSGTFSVAVRCCATSSGQRTTSKDNSRLTLDCCTRRLCATSSTTPTGLRLAAVAKESLLHSILQEPVVSALRVVRQWP